LIGVVGGAPVAGGIHPTVSLDPGFLEFLAPQATVDGLHQWIGCVVRGYADQGITLPFAAWERRRFQRSGKGTPWSSLGLGILLAVLAVLLAVLGVLVFRLALVAIFSVLVFCLAALLAILAVLVFRLTVLTVLAVLLVLAIFLRLELVAVRLP